MVKFIQEMTENNKEHRTVEELEHFKIWAHFIPKQPCKVAYGLKCYPQIDLQFCWTCFDEREGRTDKCLNTLK